jgi:hypothetical protein
MQKCDWDVDEEVMKMKENTKNIQDVEVSRQSLCTTRHAKLKSQLRLPHCPTMHGGLSPHPSRTRQMAPCQLLENHH